MIILLALVGAAWAYYHFTPTTANTTSAPQSINYGQPTQDEISTGESIKNNASSGNGSDQSSNPEPSTDGSLSEVGMEITASNQDESYLYVRTLIQTLTSSGTCTLTMTGPASKLYVATSGVQALPSTSTCAGFNIPLSSLSLGIWTISIKFTNTAVKASISKEITIQQ